MRSIKYFSKITIAIIICVASVSGKAQNQYIIIGDTLPGFTHVYINDSVLSPKSQFPVKIDLDNNQTSDLIFKIIYNTVKYSSIDKYYEVTVESSDNVTFANTQAYDKSDTLYADSCQYIKKTLLWFTPTSYYMAGWKDGIHYIGIKKTINNSIHLGWIKINVQLPTTTILEYAIQTIPVGIRKLEESTASLYPNPAKDVLKIVGTACRKIEIYNALGSVVCVEENKDNLSTFSINIGNLSPGVYFTKIVEQDKERVSVKKFIKQ